MSLIENKIDHRLVTEYKHRYKYKLNTGTYFVGKLHFRAINNSKIELVDINTEFVGQDHGVSKITYRKEELDFLAFLSKEADMLLKSYTHETN